eukprot:gene8698-10218_t
MFNYVSTSLYTWLTFDCRFNRDYYHQMKVVLGHIGNMAWCPLKRLTRLQIDSTSFMSPALQQSSLLSTISKLVLSMSNHIPMDALLSMPLISRLTITSLTSTFVGPTYLDFTRLTSLNLVKLSITLKTSRTSNEATDNLLQYLEAQTTLTSLVVKLGMSNAEHPFYKDLGPILALKPTITKLHTESLYPLPTTIKSYTIGVKDIEIGPTLSPAIKPLLQSIHSNSTLTHLSVGNLVHHYSLGLSKCPSLCSVRFSAVSSHETFCLPEILRCPTVQTIIIDNINSNSLQRIIPASLVISKVYATPTKDLYNYHLVRVQQQQ